MEIEASSPLAALQPHHPSSWSSHSPNRPRSKSLFGPKLNLKSRMEDSTYFDLASPASSLAADLSQNFHIDKTFVQSRRVLFVVESAEVDIRTSPQHPTPRRSLFPFGGLHGRSTVTTPPIPTSSPIGDAMDISPLPHKPPFQATRSPMSPSPDLAMDMCSSPPSAASQLPRSDFLARRSALAERKRSSNFTKPSLLKQHRHTSSGIPFKSTGTGSSTPTSLFGRTGAAPQIKLEDFFGSSPPRAEKKVGFSGLLTSSPPAKPSFMASIMGSGGSSAGLDGSPIAPLNRPKFNRPKSKVRRTLSMFEHPEDVMQREQESQPPKFCLSPFSNSSPGENSTLPCFTNKDDPLRRIHKEILCHVLDGRYQEHYDEIFVVDCRFEYEYEGGHVVGAININCTETLDKLFFDVPKTGRVLVVFHCEYSAHRAPRMALHLRSRDRQINMHRYPALFYPDVYILDGGYSSFFNNHSERCEPQNYVEMSDASHRQACEKEMGKFRRNTKFGRTQSFTFGAHNQGDHSVESSPSANFGKRAPTGGCSRESINRAEADSSTFGSRQRAAETRRMVSY